MASSDLNKSGKVYLVGAGPGDPGMLTLRAVECLRRADVVMYDYLVNPRVLRHVRTDAETVCLGRHGQGRIWSQAEINERLVEIARQGKTVARLKGGDPAVFARGAEEAEYLAANEIAFEIVPGITVALAAGSCAGIPITHRDFASAVALVTGQERPDKEYSAIDFEALARFPGTIVFYMGVTTAERWTNELISAGKPRETPVAIIRRCSFPDQVTVRCRLDEVVAKLTTPSKIRPPAIVIVGEVTALADTISWFEKRPLFGQRILITRPSGQAESLHDRLSELGAEVLEQPAIQISDPEDWAPVDRAIDRLNEFDWLAFTSANGVHYFLRRLFSQNKDLRALGHLKLAAIGPGTARTLAEYYLNVDVQPEQYRAESLVDALSSQAPGKRFLYVRASRGREVLADGIRDASGEIDQVVVYSNTDEDTPDENIKQLLDTGDIHWTTVTSSAIARSTVSLFGQSLSNTKIVSISPLTSAALREVGFEPATEASEYTMNGVIDAILKATDS